MSNSEIATILYEMSAFYEMTDVAFKPRAYEKAAETIASLDEELSRIYKQNGLTGLDAIPGVGRGIAEHIEELLKTGRLKKYTELKKHFPVKLSELMRVEGIGPKTIKVLYQKLGVKTLADLKKAAHAGKISKMPGFGEKSEKKILAGLEFQSKNSKRFLLGQVSPLVEDLKTKLQDSGLFKKMMVGGSYRRMQETVGDIDILATAKNPKKAMDYFVGLKGQGRVLQHGNDKSEIKLTSGLQIDLRLVPEKSWGAGSQYFTGPLAHNIKMRKIAIDRGYKLSEYGLTPLSPPSRGGKGRGVIVDTEEQVYHALGMDWIPPELRTDSGEIEAAQAHQLPKLIGYDDLRGDLQVQTRWTDGSASIAEMARAAHTAGLEYIAITDHTKTLAMTGGLDEKKLLRQMKEIDTLRFRSGQNSCRILKGAEVNILKDGSLDIDNQSLARLDVVGVAVHSHFKMTRRDMTRRIVRALSNPYVDMFFHPTTRLIQKRPSIDFDFDKILQVAKKHRVAIEANAHPERLDIHDTMVRRAVNSGVKLVINSDAHSVKGFADLKFGIGQARRGWAVKNDVVNTKGVGQLLKYFKKKL